MNYRLLALDLDGTLLGHDQLISPEDRDAIAAAQRAGCLVVPCTGRGWREAVRYLESVPGLTLGVFNTGAVVAEMESGRAIDLAEFEPHVVLELVEFMRDLPEAVLVYQEFERTGCDYLVTGDGRLTDNTARWFKLNHLLHKINPHPTVEDLRYSLRVGVVAVGRRAFEIEEKVNAAFAGRVSMHCFSGVPTARAEDAVFIVEVFAAGVNKWRGLRWIAERHGIADAQVAAIGDEVNDITMLSSAGCGVAMGNAVAEAKAAAKHLTLEQSRHGVAHAIRKMLDGIW